MRVSDNTSRNAVHDALGRTRSKIEDLQVKNATLKKINAPSDDPVGNAKIMDIRTQTTVNTQYEANAHTAKDRLSLTEGAVQELTDLLVRAKEIALNQASGPSATKDSRLGVAQEVSQLYKQVVSIANRRAGDYYLFGGFKTLNPPYTTDGQYLGDKGEIPLEIQKGVLVNMNVPGPQAFQVRKFRPDQSPSLLKQEDEQEIGGNFLAKKAAENASDGERAPAQDSPNSIQPNEVTDLFRVIESLRVGLYTNDTETIRGTIESLDDLIQNSITLRSKIGARVMGIDAAIASSDRTNVQNQATASALEDADYAEIWSNLAKEETVMRASLQAAQKLIQPTLLDFMR